MQVDGKGKVTEGQGRVREAGTTHDEMRSCDLLPHSADPKHGPALAVRSESSGVREAGSDE